MKPSDGSDFVHDEDYLEVKELVKEGRELEKSEQFKAAKNKFLDAAAKSLEIAKKAAGVEKLTYENITRQLIDYAKEIQMFIELAQNPLPHIPTMRKATSPKAKVPDSQSTILKPTKITKPPIHQILIIKTVGVPVYSVSGTNLTEKTQEAINEILFSGAISAVNQLLQEVLQKPIQNIQFEGGYLIQRFIDDYIFIVYADCKDPKLVEPAIKKFSDKVLGNVFPRYADDIKKGLSMNNNQEMKNLVTSNFTIHLD